MATVDQSPYWGGGIALALAYYAQTGKFKPSDEPQEHREFNGPTTVITKANLDEFRKTTPKYDWKDFWGLSKGQIRYAH